MKKLKWIFLGLVAITATGCVVDVRPHGSYYHHSGYYDHCDDYYYSPGYIHIETYGGHGHYGGHGYHRRRCR